MSSDDSSDIQEVEPTPEPSPKKPIRRRRLPIKKDPTIIGTRRHKMHRHIRLIYHRHRPVAYRKKPLTIHQQSLRNQKRTRVTRQIWIHQVAQFQEPINPETGHVPDRTVAETVEEFLSTSKQDLPPSTNVHDEVAAVGVEYEESAKVLHFGRTLKKHSCRQKRIKFQLSWWPRYMKEEKIKRRGKWLGSGPVNVYKIGSDPILYKCHWNFFPTRCAPMQLVTKSMLELTTSRRDTDDVIRDSTYFVREFFMAKAQISFRITRSADVPIMFVPPILQCGYFPLSAVTVENKKDYLGSRFQEAQVEYMNLTYRDITPKPGFKGSHITETELYNFHFLGKHIHGFWLVWEKATRSNQKNKRYLVDMFHHLFFPLDIPFEKWEHRLRIAFDVVTVYNLHLAEIVRVNRSVFDHLALNQKSFFQPITFAEIVNLMLEIDMSPKYYMETCGKIAFYEWGVANCNEDYLSAYFLIIGGTKFLKPNPELDLEYPRVMTDGTKSTVIATTGQLYSLDHQKKVTEFSVNLDGSHDCKNFKIPRKLKDSELLLTNLVTDTPTSKDSTDPLAVQKITRRGILMKRKELIKFRIKAYNLPALVPEKKEESTPVKQKPGRKPVSIVDKALKKHDFSTQFYASDVESEYEGYLSESEDVTEQYPKLKRSQSSESVFIDTKYTDYFFDKLSEMHQVRFNPPEPSLAKKRRRKMNCLLQKHTLRFGLIIRENRSYYELMSCLDDRLPCLREAIAITKEAIKINEYRLVPRVFEIGDAKRLAIVESIVKDLVTKTVGLEHMNDRASNGLSRTIQDSRVAHRNFLANFKEPSSTAKLPSAPFLAMEFLSRKRIDDGAMFVFARQEVCEDLDDMYGRYMSLGPQQQYSMMLDAKDERDIAAIESNFDYEERREKQLDKTPAYLIITKRSVQAQQRKEEARRESRRKHNERKKQEKEGKVVEDPKDPEKEENLEEARRIRDAEYRRIQRDQEQAAERQRQVGAARRQKAVERKMRDEQRRQESKELEDHRDSHRERQNKTPEEQEAVRLRSLDQARRIEEHRKQEAEKQMKEQDEAIRREALEAQRRREQVLRRPAPPEHETTRRVEAQRHSSQDERKKQEDEARRVADEEQRKQEEADKRNDEPKTARQLAQEELLAQCLAVEKDRLARRAADEGQGKKKKQDEEREQRVAARRSAEQRRVDREAAQSARRAHQVQSEPRVSPRKRRQALDDVPDYDDSPRVFSPRETTPLRPESARRSQVYEENRSSGSDSSSTLDSRGIVKTHKLQAEPRESPVARPVGERRSMLLSPQESPSKAKKNVSFAEDHSRSISRQSLGRLEGQRDSRKTKSLKVLEDNLEPNRIDTTEANNNLSVDRSLSSGSVQSAAREGSKKAISVQVFDDDMEQPVNNFSSAGSVHKEASSSSTSSAQRKAHGGPRIAMRDTVVPENVESELLDTTSESRETFWNLLRQYNSSTTRIKQMVQEQMLLKHIKNEKLRASGVKWIMGVSVVSCAFLIGDSYKLEDLEHSFNIDNDDVDLIGALESLVQVAVAFDQAFRSAEDVRKLFELDGFSIALNPLSEYLKKIVGLFLKLQLDQKFPKDTDDDQRIKTLFCIISKKFEELLPSICGVPKEAIKALRIDEKLVGTYCQEMQDVDTAKLPEEIRDRGVRYQLMVDWVKALIMQHLDRLHAIQDAALKDFRARTVLDYVEEANPEPYIEEVSGISEPGPSTADDAPSFAENYAEMSEKEKKARRKVDKLEKKLRISAERRSKRVQDSEPSSDSESESEDDSDEEKEAELAGYWKFQGQLHNRSREFWKLKVPRNRRWRSRSVGHEEESRDSMETSSLIDLTDLDNYVDQKLEVVGREHTCSPTFLKTRLFQQDDSINPSDHFRIISDVFKAPDSELDDLDFDEEEKNFNSLSNDSETYSLLRIQGSDKADLPKFNDEGVIQEGKSISLVMDEYLGFVQYGRREIFKARELVSAVGKIPCDRRISELRKVYHTIFYLNMHLLEHLLHRITQAIFTPLAIYEAESSGNVKPIRTVLQKVRATMPTILNSFFNAAPVRRQIRELEEMLKEDEAGAVRMASVLGRYAIERIRVPQCVSQAFEQHPWVNRQYEFSQTLDLLRINIHESRSKVPVTPDFLPSAERQYYDTRTIVARSINLFPTGMCPKVMVYRAFNYHTAEQFHLLRRFLPMDRKMMAYFGQQALGRLHKIVKNERFLTCADVEAMNCIDRAMVYSAIFNNPKKLTDPSRDLQDLTRIYSRLTSQRIEEPLPIPPSYIGTTFVCFDVELVVAMVCEKQVPHMDHYWLKPAIHGRRMDLEIGGINISLIMETNKDMFLIELLGKGDRDRADFLHFELPKGILFDEDPFQTILAAVIRPGFGRLRKQLEDVENNQSRRHQ